MSPHAPAYQDANGRWHSEGCRRLAEHRDRLARSEVKVAAARLGVSTSEFCHWCSGRRVPNSYRARMAIQNELGIAAPLFDVAPSEEMSLANGQHIEIADASAAVQNPSCEHTEADPEGARTEAV